MSGPLAYGDLVHLVESGVIESGRLEAVGGSSVDIHLGGKILIENRRNTKSGFSVPVVDYGDREPLDVIEFDLSKAGEFVLSPGQFILAHSVEVLNMPLSMSALLRTKSSMGRIGFEHMDAGWVDPGFSGQLTLEFKNQLESHAIRIRPGDQVGQLVFFRHETVEHDNSYKARGRYNGQRGAVQIRSSNRMGGGWSWKW